MDQEKNDAAYPPCPVFLDLVDRLVVVVGGGSVAARKLGMLLRYGARVTMVAP